MLTSGSKLVSDPAELTDCDFVVHDKICVEGPGGVTRVSADIGGNCGNDQD